jgi:hypothetical protein
VTTRSRRSRFERLQDKIRNNPIGAGILIGAVGIIGLGQIASAIKTIVPTRAPTASAPTALLFADVTGARIGFIYPGDSVPLEVRVVFRNEGNKAGLVGPTSIGLTICDDGSGLLSLATPFGESQVVDPSRPQDVRLRVTLTKQVLSRVVEFPVKVSTPGSPDTVAPSQCRRSPSPARIVRGIVDTSVVRVRVYLGFSVDRPGQQSKTTLVELGSLLVRRTGQALGESETTFRSLQISP